MAVTDREPTPTPHTAGPGSPGEAGEEPSRASAHARARTLSVPPVPALLHTLFVGDPESSAAAFWRRFLARSRQRIAYARTGDWAAPPEFKDNGKPRLTGGRFVYLALTVLLGIPIAFVLDFLDWATFPLGRLGATAAVIALIIAIL